MAQNNISFDFNSKKDNASSGRFFRSLLKKWPWFIISVCLSLLVAYVNLRFAVPIYTSNAKIFIKSDDKGNAGGPANAFFSNMFNTTSSVDNEAEILKTRYLMERVVEILKADFIYYKEGSVNSSELYDSPFKVNVLSRSTRATSQKFLVTIKGKTVKIHNDSYSKIVDYNVPFQLKGVGIVSIVLKDKKIKSGEYSFSVVAFKKRVAQFLSSLSVAVAGKQISIINLNFTYPNKQKGEEVLRVLMEQYQLENIKDKNRIADSTVAFVQSRLAFVSNELNDVEKTIQSFRQKNNITDIAAQSKLAVETSSQSEIELGSLNAQLEILNQLEKYLKLPQNQKRVFPSDLIDDPSFSVLIQKYNSLLLERERLLLTTTEENPYTLNIDQQLAGLRNDMLSALENLKRSKAITRKTIQGRSNDLNSKIRSVPENERTFLNLSRQQQIKQDLFIFLMQKREETAISKTSNISNSKVIEPAMAVDLPISPSRKNTYALGFIVGILLPLSVFYLLDILNNKVTSKDDVLARTAVPIIGEISHNNDNSFIALSVKSKSIISEQFRSLRTNLNFFLRLHEKQSKSILVTSSISGEGKSFTTFNLGLALAMSGKKTILLEMDLRKPGLIKHLNIYPERHFSDYILSDNFNVNDIIVQSDLNPDLYYISSGIVPPNPSEILMSDRTSQLLAELKKSFEYVIMDTPPIGIVTDAQLLSEYADMTIYMVRNNFTIKRQIEIIEDLRAFDKIKNLAIVMNDVDLSQEYGYGYAYGYGGYMDKPAPVKRKFSFFRKG